MSVARNQKHANDNVRHPRGPSVSFTPARGSVIDFPPVSHHDAKMRTTINISDGLLEEVRELARQRNRPFREVLEEVLQRGLSDVTAPRERVRILTYPVGIKPAYRGQSMNQLYDQIEAGEGFAKAGQ